MSNTRGVVTRLAAVAALLFVPFLHGPSAGAQESDPPVTGDTVPPDGSGQLELEQTWAVTPGHQDQGGTRPNLSYQVAPGAVVQDSVTVYNLGNVQLDFAIYATDAFNNADGNFDLLAAGETPVDAGSWVAVAQQGLVLDPGQQATIPITITVPADATPGDHVGGIVAAITNLSQTANQPVVRVEQRTGTRLYIQVAGPLAPELAVTDLATSYHPALNPLSGSADVSFRVENRGNVRLAGTPTVSVGGPFGIGKRTVTLPPIAEVLPGEHITLTAKLADVPALLLDSTTVRVEPTDADGVAAAVGKDRTFAPPVSVFVLLLVAIVAFIVRRVYVRHRGPGAGADALPPVAEQPALESQRG